MSQPKKLVTYKGQLVYLTDYAFVLPDDFADEVVANDVPLKDFIESDKIQFVSIENLRKDDGQPIDMNNDVIYIGNVPIDTTFVFVLEPAFYVQN